MSIERNIEPVLHALVVRPQEGCPIAAVSNEAACLFALATMVFEAQAQIGGVCLHSIKFSYDDGLTLDVVVEVASSDHLERLLAHLERPNLRSVPS